MLGNEKPPLVLCGRAFIPEYSKEEVAGPTEACCRALAVRVGVACPESVAVVLGCGVSCLDLFPASAMVFRALEDWA